MSISRKLLTDIIKDRVLDIFAVVKSTLNKQKIYDIINSGIVITGGCSQLTTLEEFAKQYFDVPVRIGIPSYDGDFADLIATPKYATGIGALYFANEYMLDEISNPVESPDTVFRKLKRLFGI